MYKSTISSQIRGISATVLLAALAVTAVTGCGGPSKYRPRPDPSADQTHGLRDALATARTKQDALCVAGRTPGWSTCSDRFADQMAAEICDPEVSYKKHGQFLTPAQVELFQARWAALPYRDELIAQEAKAAAATKAKALADAAAQRYASLPVVDHRAFLRQFASTGTTFQPAAAAATATAAAAPATGSTTVTWEAIETPDADVADLTGIFVSANEQTVLAYGPGITLRSDDAGATWTRAGSGLVTGYLMSGKVYGIDGEGRLVSDGGFVVSEDLSRAYRLAVGHRTICIETKSTIQWVGVDDHGGNAVVSGKQTKPAGGMLVAVMADGSAVCAVRGGRAVALRADGAPVLAPSDAQPNANSKLGPDHEPEFVTAATVPMQYAPYIDGGHYAGGSPGAAAGVGPSWALINLGIVDFAVRVDGTSACITDAEAAGSQARRRSPASDTVPVGTRAIAGCGPYLWAVGRRGLFKAPRWPTP